MSVLPDNGRLDLPAAWYGRDLESDPESWQVELDAVDIDELVGAAQSFIDNGQPLAHISVEQFKLPGLAPRLVKLRRELLSGKGFSLWRGLPVDSLSPELVATVFFGIGAHLGSARSQNAKGHMLGHVRDVGKDLSDSNVRVYQTTQRQTFHTDSTDVVGLLCLKAAKSGGDSLLVSAVTLFNEIQAQSPDLIHWLFEPVATDRRGEVPAGENPWFEIPVFSWLDGYLTCLYHRLYIESSARFNEAPTLTPEHREVLDRFDALANDPSVHLKMRLQPGDMQFVYNHHLLHDRTEFQDWDNPAQKRHMLRLWLSMADDRPLPESFRQRYGSIEIGNRGGILTADTQLQVPLTP